MLNECSLTGSGVHEIYHETLLYDTSNYYLYKKDCVALWLILRARGACLLGRGQDDRRLVRDLKERSQKPDFLNVCSVMKGKNPLRQPIKRLDELPSCKELTLQLFEILSKVHERICFGVECCVASPEEIFSQRSF